MTSLSILSYRPPVVLFSVILFAFIAGCASFQERLRDAERAGRLGDAFWMSVEYYDEEHTTDAREKLEHFTNIYYDRLLQSAETHVDNNRYAAAYHILSDTHGESLQCVLNAADARGIPVARRDRLDAFRSLADSRLDKYYNESVALYNNADFSGAHYRFGNMLGLKDASRYYTLSGYELQYSAANAEFSAGNFRKAFLEFGKLPSDFRDAAARRRDAFERGKIIVALYNFTGDDQQLIRNEISRALSGEQFIEVVTMSGRFGGSAGNIPNNGNEVLVVMGSVSTNIQGPSYFPMKDDTEAWVITGETQEITRKDGGKRYIRIGKPLGFAVGETVTIAEMKADYGIIDAKSLRSVYTNSRSATQDDHCRNYTFNSRYSPELFSLRNPAMDTLAFPIIQWKPSDADKKFQRNFLEKRKQLPPEVLFESTFNTLKQNIAEEILRVVRGRITEL